MELERFVCDCATPPILKKLRCKGVAMHVYSIRVTWKSIKWLWVEPFEMNEQGSDFVIGNRCRLSFNVQEAKKVSKRTVLR